MNISLTDGSGSHPAEPDDCNLVSDIDEHQEIMRSAGFNITGPAVLIPENQREYPGAYQVWSPYFDPEADAYLFVWIDPEGRAVSMDELPTADFLSARSDD